MKLEKLAGLGIVGGLMALLASLFGAGAPKTAQADTGGGSALAGVSVPKPERKPVSFDSLPSNRALTTDEVFILADAMTRHFGLSVDQFDLVTYAYIESTNRPWVERYEKHIDDYSIGLMQTLIKTAQWMHSLGYSAMPYPTRDNLKKPHISMYYGAAYIDYLKKRYGSGRDKEWLVRAYNGGAGHKYNSMTTQYWNKWIAYRRQWSTGGAIITVG